MNAGNFVEQGKSIAPGKTLAYSVRVETGPIRPWYENLSLRGTYIIVYWLLTTLNAHTASQKHFGL